MLTLGKVICAIKRKHLRGKLLKVQYLDKTPGGQNYVRAHYGCPRCGAEWTRKVRRIERAA